MRASLRWRAALCASASLAALFGNFAMEAVAALVDLSPASLSREKLEWVAERIADAKKEAES